MRALVVERNAPRFAAAFVAGAVLGPARSVGPGPLRLSEIDPPPLPGPDWRRVRPLLAGICGSDLATLSGHSSRWFESMVSFPFVPGHEVVGELEENGGGRVVLQPVLGCATRGVDPPCPACAAGDVGRCERVSFGHLSPGLQTGYCADTGGGWSASLVAHTSQLHPVPPQLSDEEAVMVEPASCGVHAALAARLPEGGLVVVLGAGTLGLCTVAALRRLAFPGTLLSVAKHREQASLARELGADVVVDPDQLSRTVRRLTRSLATGGGSARAQLSGGADAVIDCVGSADSLAEALAVVRPRGQVVLAGMPAPVRVDLAPLWQREITLTGAYTYGREDRSEGATETFSLAFELVASAGLGRLVSARYPLEDYQAAIAHAATAGRRGGVKVVFCPKERPRRPWRSS